MILSSLRQLTADFAADPDQTRFSSKYNGKINLAQQQFALDTRSLFKDTSYTSVVNTSTYALPSDFVLEESIFYNGLPLEPISRNELAILYPNTDWTLLLGTPTRYMIDPEEANKVLRLIPNPQDIKTIALRYYPLPADVSADSDVILNSSTLMVQFHMGIAALAAWLLLSGENQDDAILSKKKELLKVYNDAVSKATDTFGNTKSSGLRIRPIK